MKYDYGIEERGFSFEYLNTYLPAVDVFGKDNVLLFDFMTGFKKNGKRKMNDDLFEMIKSEKPDLTIFCLFKFEIEEVTVSKIKSFTRTLSYFYDDPWRQPFFRHWIEYFDYFSTPDFYMFKQYELEGLTRARYSPFGFNSSIYIKKDLPQKYEVSFIGGYSAYRRWVFHLLEKEGIKVNIFGRGWEGEKSWVTQEEMVDIFNQSKINLNLSNASLFDIKFLTYSLSSPFAVKNILRTKKNKEQIKGRHYEINGCGGFQLSYFVPGLNLIYEIDKEIAAFENVHNLPDIIRFFLKSDEQRSKIAAQGYQRSIKEHTAQGYIERLCKSVFQF
jgi:spore maturation protein CgeB